MFLLNLKDQAPTAVIIGRKFHKGSFRLNKSPDHLAMVVVMASMKDIPDEVENENSVSPLMNSFERQCE